MQLNLSNNKCPNQCKRSPHLWLLKTDTVPPKTPGSRTVFNPGEYSMAIPKMCSLLDAGRKILLIHTGLIYTLEHPPMKIISPTPHSPSAKNSQQRTPAVSIPLPSSVSSSPMQVHEPPTRNHLKCRVTTALLTKTG